MLYWLFFMACTGAIVFSGVRLSRYGDVIAERSGLGRAWVGVALMASVTSLPELVTGVSSITLADAPDIALGDILGSCVFNLLIYAMLDAMVGRRPLSAQAQSGNIISAGFGALMLSVAAVGIFFAGSLPVMGVVGPYSVVLAIAYIVAIRMIFLYEKRRIAAVIHEAAREIHAVDITLRTAIVRYALNSLIVVAAAMALPFVGKGLAESTGLGQTFVGNIFIALSTSLPEIVVSVAAVRLGALDLAIGNLFGSNIVNMFILAMDDILYQGGHILEAAKPGHMASALTAIGMSAVAIIGLTYRAEHKRFVMAWDALTIVLLYGVYVLTLYSLI